MIPYFVLFLQRLLIKFKSNKKSILIVLGLFIGLSFNPLSAQTCQHAKKDAKSCSASSAAVSEAALKAAEADATIEKKVCEKSGKVSFQRKSTDAAGTVTYNDVVFDEGKAMFVSADGSSMSDSKKSCTGGESKACCKKGAKSCCKKGAKTCSKDGASSEQAK